MAHHRATKVVTTALLIAKRKGELRLPDVKSRADFGGNQPSDGMIRRVLRQLEASGWLERKHPEGRVWYSGEKLKEFLK